MNGISYEGTIISMDKETKKVLPLDFNFKQGKISILRLVIAERHSDKNGKVEKDPNRKEKYYDPTKGADEYVNTTTSWHRLTIFGDKAEAYAQDPKFNHGALVEVKDVTYVEEGEWRMNDGVMRAGRPETAGDKKGDLKIKFPPKVKPGESARPATWDGFSEMGYAGGGGQQAVSDDDAMASGF
ncbi:hypothetical protein CMP1-46 [Clavibacter phage CMP1]|uniref:Uncharacterized protein ssb n=1 Tax=Clavibacter phage CMP1 TaxID=686439 RepID=D0U230_9CAUD|nr:hypothetical protein CMP1-46 [Clavibacter phage CMP1]ACY35942.1 hypothetical protein CMP1-46 [Clavibacter phage CMP1]